MKDYVNLKEIKTISMICFHKDLWQFEIIDYERYSLYIWWDSFLSKTFFERLIKENIIHKLNTNG